MASIIAAEPFDTFKDQLRVINKIEREMHRNKYKYSIQIDGNCVICYYDNKETIHNEN